MSQRTSKRQAQTGGRKNSRSSRKFSTPLLLALSGVLLVVAALAIFSNGQKANQNVPAGFTPEASGPKLKVDQELVDFGPVKMGIPIQAAFTLTNVGDQTLEFNKQPYISVVEGC